MIGCLDHHWKPATAATDTITPVTMSFFISAILDDGIQMLEANPGRVRREFDDNPIMRPQ
jgi:hypothetical protein